MDFQNLNHLEKSKGILIFCLTMSKVVRVPLVFREFLFVRGERAGPKGR